MSSLGLGPLSSRLSIRLQNGGRRDEHHGNLETNKEVLLGRLLGRVEDAKRAVCAAIGLSLIHI